MYTRYDMSAWLCYGTYINNVYIPIHYLNYGQISPQVYPQVQQWRTSTMAPSRTSMLAVTDSGSVLLTGWRIYPMNDMARDMAASGGIFVQSLSPAGKRGRSQIQM